MTPEELELAAEESEEFGAPESVEVDMNAHINHTLQSFAQQNMQAQWKIGQHAAEIDALKQALAEKDAEAKAWKQTAEHYQHEAARLEEAATLTGDHQRVDDFLAAVSGQPGLGGDER